MRFIWGEIQSNAVAFSKRCKDAKSEEAQSQSFLTDFLRVFGVNNPEDIGNFEYKVPLKTDEWDILITVGNLKLPLK